MTQNESEQTIPPTPFDAEIERLSREFNSYLIRVRNLRLSNDPVYQVQALHAICHIRLGVMRAARQIASGSEVRADYVTNHPDKCNLSFGTPDVEKMEADLFS